MLEEWYAWIWHKLNIFVPKRTTFRSSLSPWITSQTSNKIKRLNTARKTGKKTVPQLEAKVKEMIMNDQLLYQERVLAARDSHTLFKHFKSLKDSKRLPNYRTHIRHATIILWHICLSIGKQSHFRPT